MIFGDFMTEKLKAVILDGHTENPGDLSWGPIEALVDLTVYPRTEPELVVERAKDADIVIYDGDPLEIASSVKYTIVNGEIAWQEK